MEDPKNILNELLANDAWIRSLARHLVTSHSDAEDVAQDAWVAALRNPPHKPGAIPGWLTRVVRRIAWTRQHTEDQRRQREQTVAKPDFAEVRRNEAARHRVATAVFALEEPYHSAIYYRYFENLPPREIAKRLNVTVVAVETRLRRGLQKLRARLDRDFGDRKTWCTALLPLTGLTAGEATAVTAATTGALIMGIKIKIGIAVLLLAGAGLALWKSIEDQIPATGKRVTRDPEHRTASTNTAHDPRVDVATSPSSGMTSEGSEHAAANPAPAHSIPARFSITGTVREASGQLLAGAAVRAYRVDISSVFGCFPTPALETTTDANGGFLLGPLEYKVVLEAEYSGLGRVRTCVPPGSKHDFVLDAPGSLRGEVRYGSGGPPCANAAVVARMVDSAAPSRVEEIRYHAVSDSRGCYRFSDLPSQRYDVRVFPTTASPTRRRTHEVVVKAGTVTTLDILVAPLSTGVRLTGRVTDAATDEPIPGARVNLAQNPCCCAVTGEDGRFSLQGLTGRVHPRPRRHTLRVSAANYLSERVYLDVTGENDVHQDVSLEKPARVHGVVVDPAGKPVNGARISLWLDATREDLWKYSARTGPAGTFEITCRPSGALRIFANADGFGGGISDPLFLRNGQLAEGIRIRLVRGATVTGTITDERGGPLKDIWIHLFSERGAAVRTSGFSAPVQSDPNGAYRLESVHPGCYRIKAEKLTVRDGKAVGARHLQKRIDVCEGGSYRCDFRWFTGLSVSGRVIDDKKAPVAGVYIRAAPLGATPAKPARTCTDSRGCFDVEGLSPGLYSLTIIDRRFLLHKFEDVLR